MISEYDALLDQGAAFYREHGVVDLTLLAEAAAAGFNTDTFQADVVRRAEEPTEV